MTLAQRLYESRTRHLHAHGLDQHRRRGAGRRAGTQSAAPTDPATCRKRRTCTPARPPPRKRTKPSGDGSGSGPRHPGSRRPPPLRPRLAAVRRVADDPCRVPRHHRDGAAGAFELRLRGRILKFDGHTRVLPSRDEDKALPDLRGGRRTAARQRGRRAALHQAAPAATARRAWCASWRSAASAAPPPTCPSISTIQDRGYVTLQKRRSHAERHRRAGDRSTGGELPELMSYSFTADMETDLDQVAEGQRAWRSLLDAFYADFSGQLAAAQGEAGMRANEPTATSIACGKCTRPMQLRTAGTGVFLGCSGYALPPEGALRQHHESRARRRGRGRGAGCGGRIQAAASQAEVPGVPGADGQLPDRRHPQAAHLRQQPGLRRPRGGDRRVPAQGLRRPRARVRQMRRRDAAALRRFGKFFGCTSDDCKNTRKLLRNGQPAPPKRTRCRCRNCAAPASTTTTCCATAPPASSWPPADFRGTGRRARRWCGN